MGHRANARREAWSNRRGDRAADKLGYSLHTTSGELAVQRERLGRQRAELGTYEESACGTPACSGKDVEKCRPSSAGCSIRLAPLRAVAPGAPNGLRRPENKTLPVPH